MLKNGVVIRGPRHHWISGLRPTADAKNPTAHLRAQVKVTLLSTLQRSAGSGARKVLRTHLTSCWRASGHYRR